MEVVALEALIHYLFDFLNKDSILNIRLHYRRGECMVSETKDQGSDLKPEDTLQTSEVSDDSKERKEENGSSQQPSRHRKSRYTSVSSGQYGGYIL